MYSVRPYTHKTRMNTTATSAQLTVVLMCSAIGVEMTYRQSSACVLDGSCQHQLQALLLNESFLRLDKRSTAGRTLHDCRSQLNPETG